MTQSPRLEARVRAQERMQNMLHARIEELAEDMTAGFQQQANYQIQTERRIEARFDEMRMDIAAIKTNMVAMETRILDTFKQLLITKDTQHTSTQG